jgi:hypothetical protein
VDWKEVDRGTGPDNDPIASPVAVMWTETKMAVIRRARVFLGEQSSAAVF